MNKNSENEVLISIIVPCFNNEKYVEKCLESIANQTIKNFEVIIINDGSKDNSQKVIETFISTHLNFKLINQVNMGVSSARNNGLKEANGNYVCFVDADDYIEPNYLYELYNALEANDSDLSICSVIHETLDGKTIYIDQLNNTTLTNMETANLKKLIWGYACNKLFKTKLIKKHKLVFEPSIKFAEDELFYLNYLFNCSKVSMIDKALYHYVRQKKSATKNKSNMDVQVNRFVSRRMIIDLLIRNNVDQYVINRHIIACVDTCLLVLAYKFKDKKLNKSQKEKYLNYIKSNKDIYLNNETINWKAKFYLKLACFNLALYIPIRRLQLRLTHRL